MACSWSKQPIWMGTGSPYLNAVNDATIGGQITTVPNGNASEFNQTLPGDHFVLDEAGALAASNTNIGTLHGGYFQYVLLDASATALYLGQTLYWKMTSNTSGVYTVTNVQTGNTPNFAGVLLNPNWTPGNYSWIQALGRVNTLVDAASGAVSIGSSMSLSASTGTSNGSIAVSTSTSLAAPSLYVGIAETAVAAPAAGLTTLLDIQKVTLRF